MTEDGKQQLKIKQTGRLIPMDDLGWNGTIGFFRRSDWL